MIGPAWGAFGATTPEEKISGPFGIFPEPEELEEIETETPSVTLVQGGIGFAVIGLAIFGALALWKGKK
jgi:hypothetical protein